MIMTITTAAAAATIYYTEKIVSGICFASL